MHAWKLSKGKGVDTFWQFRLCMESGQGRVEHAVKDYNSCLTIALLD